MQTELVASNAARDLLTGCETELANLKESQATSLQKRARDTYQSCQETFGREKAQLSVRRCSASDARHALNFRLTPHSPQNDLKRANNKLEELTTRNQKLSTELAKFK